MMKLESIIQISRSEQSTYRQQVLDFLAKYGTNASIDAFGVSKPTLYRWRKKYVEAKKDAVVLIPKSTRPKTVRVMQVDPLILQFLRFLREEHRRIGKEKIKPLLDEYCQEKELVSISESSIGRVIKKYHLFFQKKGRIYHDPSINYKAKRISYKTRIKHSPRETKLGYYEIDTITRYSQGKKVYVINGIDVCSRYTFSFAYGKLNSHNAEDYLKRLSHIYPMHSKQITD